MGVYYYFVNTRTGATNEHPIPGHGKCSFVAKLDSIDIDLKALFQSVISVNNDWLLTDVIMACPDYEYHKTIVYKDGVISYEASIEEY